MPAAFPALTSLRNDQSTRLPQESHLRSSACYRSSASPMRLRGSYAVGLRLIRALLFSRLAESLATSDLGMVGLWQSMELPTKVAVCPQQCVESLGESLKIGVLCGKR